MKKPRWIGYVQASLDEKDGENIKAFAADETTTAKDVDELHETLSKEVERLTIDDFNGNVQVKLFQVSEKGNEIGGLSAHAKTFTLALFILSIKFFNHCDGDIHSLEGDNKNNEISEWG